MNKRPNHDHAGLAAVFSYSQARTAGISSDRLHAYQERGLIQQLGRGLYRWGNATDVDEDLVEVAHRAPRGALCLVTALARHGLTDIIPARLDVAIPRGTRIPTLRSPVHIHVFAEETFELGREEFDIGGQLRFGLYSAERTLIDVIRLRHREGSDIAWDALRRWLRRKGTKPARLIELAKKFHGAERAVRAALEVVL